MAITSNAAITMSALRAEYKGGSAAVSMSQLNRGGGHVPSGGARNSSIPTSDSNLSFSKYRNTSKTVVVVYQLIGAGGAGGYGVEDGGSRGTYALGGGTTTLVATSGTITGPSTQHAWGGAGGENMGGEKGTHGTAGASTAYGAGGAGGGENQHGGDAGSSAYGAGGGGGGGDDGSTYDEGGRSGFGGGAGTRMTGSVTVNYSTSISLSVGAGGIGPTTEYDGGNGAGGYAEITWDGKSHTRNHSSVLGSTPISYTIN